MNQSWTLGERMGPVAKLHAYQVEYAEFAAVLRSLGITDLFCTDLTSVSDFPISPALADTLANSLGVGVDLAHDLVIDILMKMRKARKGL